MSLPHPHALPRAFLEEYSGGMKRLLSILLLYVVAGVGQIFALPPCPEDENAYLHNCYGTYTWADGGKYVGEWKNWQKHGVGAFTSRNGGKYVGGWKDNKRDGQGTMTFSNGEKLVGEFKDNNFVK